ncbi:MAG: hypothetical protein ACE5LH_01440 [Fidelibacterota bacterium]
MKLRLPISAAAVLIAPIPVASGQASDTVSSGVPAGSHALEFQVRNLVSLSSFSGTTVSYKRYLIGHAFRIGISMSHSSTDGTGGRKEEWIFSELDSLESVEFDVRTNQRRTSSEVLGQFLFYGLRRTPFDTYWGVGPVLGYESRVSDRERWPQDTTGYDPSRYYEYQIHMVWENFYGGVVASVGVEWVWRTHLTLVAEYTSTAKYGSSRSRDEERRMGRYRVGESIVKYIQESDESISGPFIRFSSGVKFGVVIWF